MAEQKKRGFHALEDRIHQLEEEEAAKQQQAGTQQGKDAGAERRGPGGEESQKTRK